MTEEFHCYSCIRKKNIGAYGGKDLKGRSICKSCQASIKKHIELRETERMRVGRKIAEGYAHGKIQEFMDT